MRDPHHRNLRKHRLAEPGRAYHIVTCTAGRRPWFTDFASARIVVRCLAHEDRLRHVDTLAFCLMPDHLHWVFQLYAGAALDSVVQAVKSVSAHRINQRLVRTGAIWEPAIYDTAIRNGDDISGLIDYVVANPIRKGLTTDLRRYPHWDARWVPNWVGV
jgi:REP element-mobilizing transposase RayT